MKNFSHLRSSSYGDCHYLSHGPKDAKHVMIFLHGIPTNAWLWRNIIDKIDPTWLCVAPDLLGMGQSKPKADLALDDFSVFNHIAFIEQFLSAWPKATWTFVMHGWGSIIGSDIAKRHPDRVRGLAYAESYLRPTHSPEMLSLPMQELLHLLQHHDDMAQVILEENFMIEQWLPKLMIPTLSEEIMALYRSPFIQPSDRKVLLKYLYEVPFGHQRTSIVRCIEQYSEFLMSTNIPKCLLYALPGVMTTMDTVAWAKSSLPNLYMADLGEALHCAQESCPDRFADALYNWTDTLVT